MPIISESWQATSLDQAAPVSWTPPNPFPILPAQALHLWRIPLDITAECKAMLAGVLSPDETQRASAFRFAIHRDRFIVARGMLRTILAAYLQMKPACLHFHYGQFGKPALEGGLSFNLSHAQDYALLAVARAWPVGVDIAQLRNDLEFRAIAEHILPPAMIASLDNCTPEALPQAFFTCWTRYEACMKALGCGLPGERFMPEESPSANWYLADFLAAPGYLAALAVAGTPDAVACWDGGMLVQVA